MRDGNLLKGIDTGSFEDGKMMDTTTNFNFHSEALNSLEVHRELQLTLKLVSGT